MNRLLTGLGWTFASLFWAVLILGNLLLLAGTAFAGNPCQGLTPNTNGWCKCNCINNRNPFPGCRGGGGINQGVVNCCNNSCDIAYPSPPPEGSTPTCVTDVSNQVPAGCTAAQPSTCYITDTQDGTQCTSSPFVPWPSGGTASLCMCS
jgi:hypothetical protein